MKQSKRISALILSLVMMFSLFGCSAQADPQTDDGNIIVSVKDAGQDPAALGNAPAAGGANIESGVGPMMEIAPAAHDYDSGKANKENANNADEEAPEADSEEYRVTVHYVYDDGSQTIAKDPVEYTVTPSERYTVKTPGVNTKADNTAHVLPVDFTNPTPEAQVEIHTATALNNRTYTTEAGGNSLVVTPEDEKISTGTGSNIDPTVVDANGGYTDNGEPPARNPIKVNTNTMATDLSTGETYRTADETITGPISEPTGDTSNTNNPGGNDSGNHETAEIGDQDAPSDNDEETESEVIGCDGDSRDNQHDNPGNSDNGDTHVGDCEEEPMTLAYDEVIVGNFIEKHWIYYGENGEIIMQMDAIEPISEHTPCQACLDYFRSLQEQEQPTEDFDDDNDDIPPFVPGVIPEEHELVYPNYEELLKKWGYTKDEEGNWIAPDDDPEPTPEAVEHYEPTVGDVTVTYEFIIHDDCVEVVTYVHDAHATTEGYWFYYSEFVSFEEWEEKWGETLPEEQPAPPTPIDYEPVYPTYNDEDSPSVDEDVVINVTGGSVEEKPIVGVDVESDAELPLQPVISDREPIRKDDRWFGPVAPDVGLPGVGGPGDPIPVPTDPTLKKM